MSKKVFSLIGVNLLTNYLLILTGMSMCAHFWLRLSRVSVWGKVDVGKLTTVILLNKYGKQQHQPTKLNNQLCHWQTLKHTRWERVCEQPPAYDSVLTSAAARRRWCTSQTSACSNAPDNLQTNSTGPHLENGRSRKDKKISSEQFNWQITISMFCSLFFKYWLLPQFFKQLQDI